MRLYTVAKHVPTEYDECTMYILIMVLYIQILKIYILCYWLCPITKTGEIILWPYKILIQLSFYK